MLHGLSDLSSPTRDWTRTTAMKVLCLNHWTTREFCFWSILKQIPLFYLRPVEAPKDCLLCPFKMAPWVFDSFCAFWQMSPLMVDLKMVINSLHFCMHALLFIYLFLAALSLHCCIWAFSMQQGKIDIKKVHFCDEKYLWVGFTWTGNLRCSVPLCAVCAELTHSAMALSPSGLL